MSAAPIPLCLQSILKSGNETSKWFPNLSRPFWGLGLGLMSSGHKTLVSIAPNTCLGRGGWNRICCVTQVVSGKEEPYIQALCLNAVQQYHDDWVWETVNVPERSMFPVPHWKWGYHFQSLNYALCPVTHNPEAWLCNIKGIFWRWDAVECFITFVSNYCVLPYTAMEGWVFSSILSLDSRILCYFLPHCTLAFRFWFRLSSCHLHGGCCGWYTWSGLLITKISNSLPP